MDPRTNTDHLTPPHEWPYLALATPPSLVGAPRSAGDRHRRGRRPAVGRPTCARGRATTATDSTKATATIWHRRPWRREDARDSAPTAAPPANGTRRRRHCLRLREEGCVARRGCSLARERAQWGRHECAGESPGQRAADDGLIEEKQSSL